MYLPFHYLLQSNTNQQDSYVLHVGGNIAQGTEQRAKKGPSDI